jgi:hypothetical protein
MMNLENDASRMFDQTTILYHEMQWLDILHKVVLQI